MRTRCPASSSSNVRHDGLTGVRAVPQAAHLGGRQCAGNSTALRVPRLLDFGPDSTRLVVAPGDVGTGGRFGSPCDERARAVVLARCLGHRVVGAPAVRGCRTALRVMLVWVQSFSDRTALVTGGASGIGAAIASDLRRRGAMVVTTDIEGDADRHLDVRDPRRLPPAPSPTSASRTCCSPTWESRWAARPTSSPAPTGIASST